MRNSMLLLLLAVIGTMLLVTPSFADVKYKNEKDWDKCASRVAKKSKVTLPDVMTQIIVSKCGSKPVTKSDCDGLYQTLSNECKDSSDCSDGNLYCMATMRTLMILDVPFDEFNNICEKTCKTKKLPTRGDFGKRVCKGK